MNFKINKNNYTTALIFTFIVFGIFVLAVIGDPRVYRVFKLPNIITEAVNFSEFTLKHMCLLGFSYIITAFLGYGIISNITNEIAAAKSTKIFAGFLFGYVGILLPARILSFYLSGMAFYISVVIIALSAGSYSLHQSKLHSIQNKPRLPHSPSKWSNEILVSIFAVIFVASVLCLQVTQAEFVWAGHGSNQYSTYLKTWLDSGMQHFPLIYQHYDELLYHYWATIFHIPQYDTIIPWWITLALIKLSTINFIYLAFRWLKVSVKAAIIFSIFLMFGTSTVLLYKYYLLFDAANPLYFTVHSGRIVGVSVVLYFILTYLQTLRDKIQAINYLPLVFLSLGMTGTSLSNTVWILIASFTLLLVYLKKYLPNSANNLVTKDVTKSTFLNIIPIIILILLIIQAPAQSTISHRMIVLRVLFYLLAIPVCLKWFFNYLQLTNIDKDKNSSSPRNLLITIIISTAIGLLFLGNAISTAIYENFPRLLNLIYHEIPPQYLSSADFVKDDTWNWRTLFADRRESGYYLYRSILDFAAYYSVFLISCISSFALLKSRLNSTKNFATETKVLLLILLAFLITLPSMFIFMNYLGFISRSWIKSRFIEVPIYFIIFTSLYIAYKSLKNRELSILLIILVVYSITPFVATKRPVQIYRNALKLIKTNNFIKPQITLSSQEGNYYAQNLLFMKHPGWHSVKFPHYPQQIDLNFDNPVSVDTLEFLPQDHAHDRAPNKVQILTSINKQSWVESGTYNVGCDAADTNRWHAVNLHSSVTAKYIKIIIQSNCGDESYLTLLGLRVK